MYKSFILSLFLLIGIASYGQNDTSVKSDSLDNVMSELTKMFTTKISMNVDTLIFDQKLGSNLYSSEKYSAAIFAMAIPQSIEQAEEHFEKESTKKDFKLKEKGKMLIDGKTVLYQKGTIKKNGKKLLMNIYALKGDEQTTIFISTFCLPEYEADLSTVFTNALKSAKLVSK